MRRAHLSGRLLGARLIMAMGGYEHAPDTQAGISDHQRDGCIQMPDPREVLDNIPALVGFIDRDLRVRSVNQAVCDYYGLPRTQIIGRMVPEIVGPELYARVRPGIEATLMGEAVTFYDVEPDYFGPGVDGASEEHYVPRRGPDGQVIGFDFVSIEATPRWRAELEREAELRALCRQLLIAQEEERRVVAHELHEGISQALAGLNLWLATAEAPDPHMEGAQRLVTGLTERARRLAVDLRPPELDDFNLLLVLRGHLRRFEQRSGIRAELIAPGGGHYFSDPVQTAAYRIVEEALINVERHAGVSEVGVELTVEAATLTVTIRDTGTGFDPAATGSGRGLGSMRAWAELLGGTLDITAAAGEGVTVTATLPVATPGTASRSERD
jgi:PAS domain S-box-containing protein